MTRKHKFGTSRHKRRSRRSQGHKGRSSGSPHGPIAILLTALGMNGLKIVGGMLFGLAITLLLLLMLVAPKRVDLWLDVVLLLGIPGMTLLLIWLKAFSEHAAALASQAAARERQEEREMRVELHTEGYNLDKIERKVKAGEPFHVADDGEIAFDEKPAHKQSSH